jgi:hypothetical protein
MKALQRNVLLFAVVGAVLAATGVAKATSTINIITSGITRSNSSHPNTNGATANYISRADCLNDDVISVPLSVTYDQSLSFEVWVANNSDCTVTTARTTTPTCGKVYSAGSINTITPTIPISVRDILHALNNLGQNAQGNGTADDCNAPSQSNTLPQQLDIWFMFFSGQTVDSSQDLQTKFALLGPASPSGLAVGPADTFLKLSWTAAQVGTVAGYYFFCDPLPGNEGSQGWRILDAGQISTGSGGSSGAGGAGGAGGASGDDGSASSCDASADDADEAGSADACSISSGVDAGSDSQADAGSDTGGSAISSCGIPTVLVEGTIPDEAFFSSYLCGQANGELANSGLISGLQNDYTYSVSVAAFDSLGNVGAISAAQCGTPVKVDDFLTVYRNSGGTAGGSSFCSVDAIGSARWGAGSLAFLVGTAWLGLAARRRRTGSGKARKN